MTEVDLVMVGAGTAGLPAAIEAAEQGLRTLVVEASDQLGGTLWRSWAQMSAAGTSLQRSRGIQDNPELHFDDVMRISKGTADPVLVRLGGAARAAVIEWLLRLGFDVDPACPAILHFHEPYSLPRTYWGRSGGRSVLEVLLPAAERAFADSGVTVRNGTSLVSLLPGQDRVEGVRLREADGTEREVTAGAVLLTSGGYSGDAALFPSLTGGAPLVGPGAPTSRGQGIVAARELGGHVRGEDLFLPTYGGVLLAESASQTVGLDDYPALTPQDRPPWEIHVNAQGRRFVAEDAQSVDVRENALLDQPGLTFWVVYDSATAAKAPPLFPTWKAEDLAAAFASHPSFATAGTCAGSPRGPGSTRRASAPRSRSTTARWPPARTASVVRRSPRPSPAAVLRGAQPRLDLEEPCRAGGRRAAAGPHRLGSDREPLRRGRGDRWQHAVRQVVRERDERDARTGVRAARRPGPGGCRYDTRELVTCGTATTSTSCRAGRAHHVGRPGTFGPGGGLRQVLSHSRSSGAETYLLRVADQQQGVLESEVDLYVVSGEGALDGAPLLTGDYVHVPAGSALDLRPSVAGLVLYCGFWGPSRWSDGPAGDGAVTHLRPEDMPWEPAGWSGERALSRGSR